MSYIILNDIILFDSCKESNVFENFLAHRFCAIGVQTHKQWLAIILNVGSYKRCIIRNILNRQWAICWNREYSCILFVDLQILHDFWRLFKIFQELFPGSSGFWRGSSRSKWIELHDEGNTCLDHLGFDDFFILRTSSRLTLRIISRKILDETKSWVTLSPMSQAACHQS